MYKITNADDLGILHEIIKKFKQFGQAAKMAGPGKIKYNFSEADKKYMKLAIKLAEKAAGNTSPNPMVGAVIAREGKIISTGFHKKAGSPHAEIEAINACPDLTVLEGATLYVTLEPCSVFGRTPPCTDALISRRFGEVVVGSIDPNPKINGIGIELLQKAGIKTRFGLFEDIIAKQNEVFFKSMAGKIPFVALKIASSIDGKIALKNKKSKWITSAPARETVQKIRYRYDCILTGINTVIEDDPLLYPRCAQYNRNNDRTFRDFFQNSNRDLEPGPNISSTSRNSSNAGNLDISDNLGSLGNSDNLGSLDNASNDAAVKTPLLAKKFFRVILDSGLRIGRDSNIVKTAHAIRTIIFTRAGKTIDTEKAGYLNKAGIDILKAGGRDFLTGTDDMGNTSEKRTYLDLKEVLEILYTRYEITSVLVESGPALMTEFIRQNLADKFYFFIAPKIIGGDSPFNMFSGLGISAMDDAFKLEFDKITKAGGDIFITAYPSRTGSAIV